MRDVIHYEVSIKAQRCAASPGFDASSLRALASRNVSRTVVGDPAVRCARWVSVPLGDGRGADQIPNFKIAPVGHVLMEAHRVALSEAKE